MLQFNIMNWNSKYYEFSWLVVPQTQVEQSWRRDGTFFVLFLWQQEVRSCLHQQTAQRRLALHLRSDPDVLCWLRTLHNGKRPALFWVLHNLIHLSVSREESHPPPPPPPHLISHISYVCKVEKLDFMKERLEDRLSNDSCQAKITWSCLGVAWC